MGAQVIPLENGGSAIIHNGNMASNSPRATAQQTSQSPPVPLFTVEGAEDTNYLLMFTGDVYENGEWEQLDPVLLDYGPRDIIADLLREDIDREGFRGTTCQNHASTRYCLRRSLRTTTSRI